MFPEQTIPVSLGQMVQMIAGEEARERSLLCGRRTGKIPGNEALRYSRRELGLTPEELGDLAGICVPRLRDYETGRFNPSPAEAREVSEVLDRKTEDIFPDQAHLEAPFSQLEDSELERAMADDLLGNPYRETERESLRRDVNSALGGLTERQRQVLRLRFDEELTLEDAGRELGITREMVRQVEAKALFKLRHPSIVSKLSVYIEHKIER